MSGRRLILLSTGLAIVVTPLIFWLIMLSPLTYKYPDDWRMPDSDRSHPVFVYGTLTAAPVRWLVMGRTGDPEQYTLEGFERQGLDLRKSEESRVEGLLLEVSASELRRLDRYERLGIRYERVRVPLDDDGRSAWVYRRL
ncbi:MAG: gamma-glutamylcyclotransferase family protein [Pseudomonadota bacterium]